MPKYLETQTTQLLHEVVREVVVIEIPDDERVLEIQTDHLLQDTTPCEVILEPVETLIVLETGIQGPPGPPGKPGQAGVGYVTFSANGPIGGHRAVRAAFVRHVQYADHDDVAGASAVLGITLGAADDGASVNVAASGEIVEPSWAWVVDMPIFVGAAGALTQTPPVSGFHLVVGVATSPTSMLVAIKQPIIL